MHDKKVEIKNSFGNTAINNNGIQTQNSPGNYAINNYGTQIVEQSCFHSVILRLNALLSKNEKLNNIILPSIMMASFFIWIIYIKSNFLHSGTILDYPLNTMLYFLILGLISCGLISCYVITLTLFSKFR